MMPAYVEASLDNPNDLQNKYIPQPAVRKLSSSVKLYAKTKGNILNKIKFGMKKMAVCPSARVG